MPDLLEQILEEGVEAKNYSGAVWLVYKNQKIQSKGAVGYSSIFPKKKVMRENTIFDLASLTKPLVTAPLVLKTLGSGVIDFEKPIIEQRILPFAVPLGEANICQLLTHTSGLKSWYPCYASESQHLKGRAVIGAGGNVIFEKVPKIIDQYIATIATLKMEAKPGEGVIYSCLGYIILSYIIQIKAKTGFKDAFRKIIVKPLRLKRTFIDVPEKYKTLTAAGENSNHSEKAKVAELGLKYDKWRSGIIQGEVNDCNAYYAGSGTGNAGLFADITDALEMAKQFLLNSTLFSDSELRLFREDITGYCNGNRTIAWRKGSSPDDPGDGVLTDEALSHSGYTGTAIWIEPVKEEIYILFLNRLHPRRVEFPIDKLRKQFLKVAVEI